MNNELIEYLGNIWVVLNNNNLWFKNNIEYKSSNYDCL